MKELELFKEYKYSFLVEIANNHALSEKEYGESDGMTPIIGESFLTFQNEDNLDVYSFVLIGYSIEGIYRLIYKYTA